MATSKYCHVMLFICAQVVSRRAQGNVMVNTILRMYVDYHIYWQLYGARNLKCHLENRFQFYKLVSTLECYADKVCANKMH